eukprot:g564.t1
MPGGRYIPASLAATSSPESIAIGDLYSGQPSSGGKKKHKERKSAAPKTSSNRNAKKSFFSPKKANRKLDFEEEFASGPASDEDVVDREEFARATKLFEDLIWAEGTGSGDEVDEEPETAGGHGATTGIRSSTPASFTDLVWDVDHEDEDENSVAGSWQAEKLVEDVKDANGNGREDDKRARRQVSPRAADRGDERAPKLSAGLFSSWSTKLQGHAGAQSGADRGPGGRHARTNHAKASPKTDKARSAWADHAMYYTETEPFEFEKEVAPEGFKQDDKYQYADADSPADDPIAKYKREILTSASNTRPNLKDHTQKRKDAVDHVAEQDESLLRADDADNILSDMSLGHLVVDEDELVEKEMDEEEDAKKRTSRWKQEMRSPPPAGSPPKTSEGAAALAAAPFSVAAPPVKIGHGDEEDDDIPARTAWKWDKEQNYEEYDADFYEQDHVVEEEEDEQEVELPPDKGSHFNKEHEERALAKVGGLFKSLNTYMFSTEPPTTEDVDVAGIEDGDPRLRVESVDVEEEEDPDELDEEHEHGRAAQHTKKEGGRPSGPGTKHQRVKLPQPDRANEKLVAYIPASLGDDDEAELTPMPFAGSGTLNNPPKRSDFFHLRPEYTGRAAKIRSVVQSTLRASAQAYEALRSDRCSFDENRPGDGGGDRAESWGRRGASRLRMGDVAAAYEERDRARAQAEATTYSIDDLYEVEREAATGRWRRSGSSRERREISGGTLPKSARDLFHALTVRSTTAADEADAVIDVNGRLLQGARLDVELPAGAGGPLPAGIGAIVDDADEEQDVGRRDKVVSVREVRAGHSLHAVDATPRAPIDSFVKSGTQTLDEATADFYSATESRDCTENE